jgi:hypothetical protein
MVLVPTLSEILPEATPEATVVPLTVIVAFACVFVGVTVIDVVALETEAVYEVVELAKEGERSPVERVRPESVATFDGGGPKARIGRTRTKFASLRAE